MNLARERGDPLRLLRDPTRSSEREQLIEYGIVFELLQDAWLRRRQRVDVLRADVDCAGYDLVVECQGVTRHVQLKATVEGGRTEEQKVNAALAERPSGCVVWVIISDGGAGTLRFNYLVLGGAPGQPLALDGYKVAKHTKGNAQGIKAERPAIRTVKKSAFVRVAGIAELSDWLFGSPLE